MLASVLAAGALLAWAASATAAPFVYVVNFKADDVSQYDAAHGSLRPLRPARVKVGDRPYPLRITPDGRHAYVPDAGSNAISQFAIDRGGRLRPLTPATVPVSIPLGMAITPDGRHTYVTSFQQTVTEYAIGARGGLGRIGTVSLPPQGGDCCGFLHDVAVTPDGRHAYVSAGFLLSPGTIDAFDIRRDGTLRRRGATPVPFRAPGALAVSRNGRNLYAGQDASSLIFQYAIGRRGGLSPLRPANVTTAFGTKDLGISPDGRNLWAAGASVDRVSQFAVGRRGGLSPLRPASVKTPKGPEGIGVTPNGRYVYVPDAFGEVISQFRVGPRGTLRPLARRTIPETGGPTSVTVSPPAHRRHTAGASAQPSALRRDRRSALRPARGSA